MSTEKKPQKRVTRTIVVEGDADWVDRTLARSIAHMPGKVWTAAYGSITCTERKDENL